jgi:hypothetical protein
MIRVLVMLDIKKLKIKTQPAILTWYVKISRLFQKLELVTVMVPQACFP